MGKRILVLLSEYGFWGEELIGPLETFDGAGYKVDLMVVKTIAPDGGFAGVQAGVRPGEQLRERN